MSSAEGVESAVADGQDDRLTRAFDRVARLGIDLEADDGLSEREAAAVRAFTALNLDTGAEEHVPDAGVDTDDATSPPTEAPAAPVDPPLDPPLDPPPATDGPLRPDAVLRGRPFAPRDRSVTAHLVDEVEVPPATVGADAPSHLVDHYLLDLVAVAVATGAFVAPWVWLLVVAIGALVGTAIRSLADHGPHVAALLRRAARRLVGWLRPRSVVWFAIITARTVLLAVALPGLACAAWWVVTEGTDGASVAGRMGVWAHGPRLAAATVCFMLVAGVGEARQRRAALVRQAAARLGGGTVMALAGITVVVAAGVLALVPRADAGRLAAADGLAWAPESVRDNIDRLRDDLVSAELHAASGCLTDRQGVTWRVGYTGGNPPGEADVARLAAQEGTPSPADLATAAATLHNQLAPWVEGIELEGIELDGIELRTAGTTVVVLDRALLPSGRPLVDPAELVDGATTGAGLMADGADGFDRVVALACSAAPIP